MIEVAERQPISSWATVGLYGFSSAARFAQHYEEAYERGRIRLMQGERVVAPRLERDDAHILGTPSQVLAVLVEWLARNEIPLAQTSAAFRLRTCAYFCSYTE